MDGLRRMPLRHGAAMVTLPSRRFTPSRFIKIALGVMVLIGGAAWAGEQLMSKTRVGDEAPALSATAHTGQVVNLSDYRDKQAVVLYFYPKNETRVCTAEACGFRDAYEDFTKAGAVVIGVSSDSLDSHRKFVAERKLPFLLLSDSDGAMRKGFGVPKTLGLIPGRVTYVIDKRGVVRHIFNSQFNADRHVSEALEIVKTLPQ